MQTPDPFEKLLPLHLYEELDEKQSADLLAHLDSCEGCRSQLALLQGLHEHLNQKIAMEPTEVKLTELRALLRTRVRNERISMLREPWWERLSNAIGSTNLALQLGGALAIVVLAFMTGRFTASSSEPATGTGSPALLTANEEQPPLIENIDLIEYEPATGSVTIRYKSVNDVFLQGQVEDASVKKLLVHAIRTESHPGRRLSAVRAFGSQSAADKEIESALIFALENDTVDGVRLKAAKVLKTLPISSEIKTAFIRVLLKDSNPALRIEAVEALSKVPNEADVVPIFQEASKDDENEFVRLRASKELERRVNPTIGQEEGQER